MTYFIIKLRGGGDKHMKKIIIVMSIVLISSLLLMGYSSEERTETELTVSAASSLKEVMEEVEVLYKQENPHVLLHFNLGSSGSLQRQIEQGAPVDIFFSASLKQMDALQQQDLIREETKKELVQNKIVLISADKQIQLESFNDLKSDQVEHIGIGEPSSVPVGQYTEEVFKYFGILEEIKTKAVYAKDVKEVLAWVKTGNVDVGIVYATDVSRLDDINKICIAPEESHAPVVYPIAVIKTTKHLDEAKAFIDFLGKDTAKKVFEKYGFKTK